MIITFIKIQEISTPNLSYYTVQLQSEALSEFELFDANDFSSHQNEISHIYAVIEGMGLTEAKPYYFVEDGGSNLSGIEVDNTNTGFQQQTIQSAYGTNAFVINKKTQKTIFISLKHKLWDKSWLKTLWTKR